MTGKVRMPRLLDGQMAEERRLSPTALSLSLETESASTASLTLPGGEAPLALFRFLELYTLKGSAGIFRVADCQLSADGADGAAYTLRHAIDTLHDSLWREQADFSGPMEQYLQGLLSWQTTVYWQLGDCEDSGEWKRSGLNYDHLDELLNEIRADRRDYIFQYDFSTVPWTLHLRRISQTVDCETRPTRGLKSAQARRGQTPLCNRLYLSIHTTQRKEATPSIWSAPAQDSPAAAAQAETTLRLFEDAESQAAFGVMEGTADVDTADVADVDAWAAKYLAERAWPDTQATGECRELVKTTGEPFDQFDLGKRARVAAPRAGWLVEAPVVALRYDDLIARPEDIKVSLSRRIPSFSESLADLRKQARAASGRGGGAARKAANTEAELERQKIAYNLYVDQTDRRFAVIASEAWFENAEEEEQTLVGVYSGLAETTARRLLAAYAVTGVRLDENGDPVTDGEGNYVFDGGSNALSSQLARTAEEMTSLYEKTGVNSLGQNETLYSQITQTAAQVSSKVSAGDIASTINQTAQSVLISALKINLDGYVTVSSLDATQASIDNLKNGTTQAAHLDGALVTGTTVTARNTFTFAGDTVYKRTIRLGSVQTATVLATGGATSLDFDHSHAITLAEDGGVVTATVGAAQSTEGAANFNIADTQFYQDGVSAARIYGAEHAILGGDWSGGVYTVNVSFGGTVRQSQAMTELSEITLIGTPTKSGKNLIAPCQATLAGGGTALTDNVTVDATDVYNDGWNACRDAAGGGYYYTGTVRQLYDPTYDVYVNAVTGYTRVYRYTLPNEK